LTLFIINPVAHVLERKFIYTQFHPWDWIKVCRATTHKTVYTRRQQISCLVWACYHNPNGDGYKNARKVDTLLRCVASHANIQMA